MLTQLIVKDFALIDHIQIDFDPRLNVLTGETGAGKSIIIDAVSLLLGARANSSDVRIGCQKAMVQGVFLLEKNHPVEAALHEFGHEIEEERMLILYREIASSGKNICRINDRVVTLSHFKMIGQQLINIYGQHDYQAISNKEQHLALLDSLGDRDFKALQEQVRDAYRELHQAEKVLEDLQHKAAEGNERQSFLRFKIQELQDLHLEAGEDERLEQELSLLDNYEKIVNATDKVAQYLYGDNRSVYALLSSSLTKLETVAEFDTSFTEMIQNLQSMVYIVEDYGLTLNRYRDQMDYDEGARERMIQRKYELDKLKRKYHLSIEDLISAYHKWQEELNLFENLDFELSGAEGTVHKRKMAFQRVAQELSKQRQQLASRLAEELVYQLGDLAMGAAKFEVDFTERGTSESGMDQVEFLLSANPGQPLKSLSQIASGGEMSRIMLAFKTVLARYEDIDTMIFDEIDTGIGGNILAMVADKLVRVSEASQVICVTHAPQIAALADAHFLIKKLVEHEQTKTRIISLDIEGQIHELARMLGGEEDYQLQHARQLKKLARSQQ